LGFQVTFHSDDTEHFLQHGNFFLGKHLSRGRTFGMAGCSLVSVAVKFYSLSGWVGGL